MKFKHYVWLVLASLVMSMAVVSCKDKEKNEPTPNVEQQKEKEKKEAEEQKKKDDEQKAKEEEEKKRKAEEEKKRQEEEEAKRKAEEARMQAEEEARKKAEEEKNLTPPTSDSPDISYVKTNAQVLQGDGGVKVKTLLTLINPKDLLNTDYDDVTPKELEEIRQLTNGIVKGKKNHEEKYRAIFNWIIKEIKYALVKAENGVDSNRPALVLKNRKCVCFGYANLLKIMCYTQDIPAMVVLGEAFWNNGKKIGDHAWNYVYLDGRWLVSDPTARRDFDLKKEFAKHNKVLLPLTLIFNLFENEDYVIGFKNRELSLIQVKNKAPKRLFVPFSWKGYQLTSVDPNKQIPKQVESLVLGNNIVSFGNIYNNVSGLVSNGYGKYLKSIIIKEDNPELESNGTVIYKKSNKGAMPLYILNNAEKVELMYGQTFGKNIIIDKIKLKTLIFPKTAKHIEDWAVENCPLLEKVLLPKGCTYSKNAFAGCSPKLKVDYLKD